MMMMMMSVHCTRPLQSEQCLAVKMTSGLSKHALEKSKIKWGCELVETIPQKHDVIVYCNPSPPLSIGFPGFSKEPLNAE